MKNVIVIVVIILGLAVIAKVYYSSRNDNEISLPEALVHDIYEQKLQLTAQIGINNLNYKNHDESPMKVYLLIGESSADGYVNGSEVNQVLKSESTDLLIFEYDKWETLIPSGEHNGPEISFVQKMKENYPQYQYGIIKVTLDGTSIRGFLPTNHKVFLEPGKGIRLFSEIERQIELAGKTQMDIEGILWKHFEPGASIIASSKNYNVLLLDIVNALRSRTGIANLPLYIGTDYELSEIDAMKKKEAKVFLKDLPYTYEIIKAHNLAPIEIPYTTTFFNGSLPTTEDKGRANAQGLTSWGDKFAEAVRNYKTSKLSYFPNISGSIISYTGQIDKNILTLTSEHDFKVGQGIVVKGAGKYHEGWLKTKITAIKGNTLTLQNSASSKVTNAVVNHDDSVAVQAAINNFKGLTLLFDYENLNIEGISLKSDVVYDGNNCCIFTPLYCNQDYPKNIWDIFKITNKRNIVLKNFEHNGGKNRGVNGNDQFGTTFVQAINADNCTFDNNYIHDNYYSAFRMLDTQTNITITNNKVNFTDVAFCFMPQFNGTAHFENLVIENNSIDGTGCTSEAIAILPAVYNWRNHATGEVLASSKNITIKNNIIIKPNRVTLVYGAISENVLIEGNTFSSAIAISTYDSALELKNETGVLQSSLCTSDAVMIKNNKFIYALYEAIRLSGLNVVCEGNTFSNINGDSLWVGADATGVRGTLVIKNHSFNVGSKPIILEYDKPIGNVTFINNHITASDDTTVVSLKTGIANISGNTGGTNINCIVRSGSVVANGQFKSVKYR